MKYIVYFTLPMLCSVIVEAENCVEACDMVSKRSLSHVKRDCSEFSVDNDDPCNGDICDFVRTELYEDH